MLWRLALAYAGFSWGGPAWGAGLVPVLACRRARPHLDAGALLPLALAAALGWLDHAPPGPDPPVQPARVQLWGWIASAPEASRWGSSATAVVDSLRFATPGLAAEASRWRHARVRVAWRRTLPAYGTPLAVQGALRAGRPPRNFGTAGEAAWLVASGSQAILRADSLQQLAGGRGPAWRRELLEPLRCRLAAVVDAVLAPREAGLLKALAVGRRDGVDADVAAAWSAVGVTHILSISGMHVAMVAGAVLVLLGAPHRRRGALALIVAVWTYAALGGLGPTVLRASLMATWAACATYLGRTRWPLLGLGIATLVLLLQAPERRTDLGLQLSCLATAGLLVASPTLARAGSALAARQRGGRALAWTVTAVGVGLASQTATLPLQCARFGMLSWASPAANLVLVPLTDAALALGLVGAPLGLVSQQLGRPLLLLSGALLHAAVRLPLAVTRTVGTCLYPRVDAVTVAVATLFAAATLGALAAAGAGHRRAGRAALAVAALGALTLALCACQAAESPWRFEALDVGQGDALVLTVGEAVWVVDCGDARPVDCGSRVLLPHLRRLGVRRLRGLVLTHPHGDHCGGAASLLGALPVDTLYTSCAAQADTLFLALQRAFPAQPQRCLRAGDQLALGHRYAATALWPDTTETGPADANALSLVLWTHGGELPELLLMGDLEREEEASLVARWNAALRAPRQVPRLLKAGHHGSSTSSSAPLLAAGACDVAVVSVGEHNRYRHPAPSTLRALAAHGALVLRTDRGGAVRFVVRGPTLWCERPGAAPRIVTAGPVDVAGGPP